MPRINHPDDCVICMDNLEGDVTRLRCQHVFHTACIDNWASFSVPLNNAEDPEFIDLTGAETEEEIVNRVMDATRNPVRPPTGECPVCKQKIVRDKHYDNNINTKGKYDKPNLTALGKAKIKK